MGSIYRAHQQGAAQFSKDVALKVIRKELSTNETFQRLFVGEAKLVADLVHENIVQVYHLGKVKGQYFISMEYVSGIDLGHFMATHVNRGIELEPDLGAFIISRVCRGLEYAHNKVDREGRPLNIVHRDITPRNIMINYEGVVKLTDFGIAKAARLMEQQEGSVLMGTGPYMSPEQAQGETTDGRSDLFSLGIVMYELLTGRRLFHDANLRHSLELIKSMDIPDPRLARPDLPDDLHAIMMTALKRDRAQRYQTAADMGNALEYYMYHNRYGPTNVTLGNYIKRVFLEIENPQPGLERKIMSTHQRLWSDGETMTQHIEK